MATNQLASTRPASQGRPPVPQMNGWIRSTSIPFDRDNALDPTGDDLLGQLTFHVMDLAQENADELELLLDVPEEFSKSMAKQNKKRAKKGLSTDTIL